MSSNKKFVELASVRVNSISLVPGINEFCYSINHIHREQFVSLTRAARIATKNYGVLYKSDIHRHRRMHWIRQSLVLIELDL